MQRSIAPTLLFVGIGLAAVAGASLWWLSGSRASTAPPAAGGVAPQPASVGAKDAPSVGAGAVGTGATQEPESVTGPLVQIHVTSLERFVPPPEAAAAASTAGLPVFVGYDERPLPVRVVAGTGAGFDAPRRRGTALVDVDVGSYRLLRQVAVDPLSALSGGAADAGVVRIETRIVVRGEVLGPDGASQAGATVWLGERQVDGSRRSFLTDEEGRFEADVPGGVGVPCVVSAAGCASAWRVLTVAPQMQSTAFRLTPAVSLKLQIAGRAIAIDRARAYVVPLGELSTGLVRWPFFLQALESEGGGGNSGYAFDAAGRALLSDLPANGRVGIVLRHPYAPMRAPLEVRLDHRKGEAVLVPLAVAADRWAFTTVAQGDAAASGRRPIAGISAWLHDKGRRLDAPRSLRLLPPHLDARGATYARSAADGRVEIGVPSSGSKDQLVLSLRAAGRAGRDLHWRDDLPKQLELPVWRGGEPSLQVQAPTRGERWRIQANLGDGGIDDIVPADEAFVLVLPHAGRFAIEVQVDGVVIGDSASAPLTATGPVEVATR